MKLDNAAVGQNWLEFWSYAIQVLEDDSRGSIGVYVRDYPGGAPRRR